MEYGLVVLWVAALAVLGGAGFPIAAWLFPDSQRTAAGLALPVALAVVGVVVHLVGHLYYGWPTVLVGLAVLGLLAGAASRRVALDLEATRVPALVVLAGFLFIVAIRAADPSAAPLPVSIGEKFLDFGLLQALERSNSLPPWDMWYSGERVRYHYGGHLLTNVLGTLTLTPPRFSYNLGLATFYATLLGAVYGLAAGIADQHDLRPHGAGLLTAFFVGIAANFEPAARFGLSVLPTDLARGLVGFLGLPEALATWTPAQFHYFDASRVFAVDPTNPNSAQAATEFPLFAWLNGDLHAHMMSQPFVVLVAALCLAYWLREDDGERRLILFGAIPPVVGFVGLTNVWSFPTVCGLVALTVVLAPELPTFTAGSSDLAIEPATRSERVDPRRLLVRIPTGILAAAGVALLAILWTAPYWAGVVLGGGPGKTPGHWLKWTPLGGIVLVLGPLLAAFCPSLLVAARRSDDPWVSKGLLAGAAVPVLAALASVGLMALGSVLGESTLLSVGVTDLPLIVGVAVVGGPLILVAGALVLRRQDVGFAGLLVVAGAGLIVLVDVVTVVGEHFNVIFKTYADVWLLWSTAAGVFLWRHVQGWSPPQLLERDQWRTVGAALAVVLVLTTSVYAAVALPDHFGQHSENRPPEATTLDATAYLEEEFPAEAPAIRWLDAREGRPVIVTAAPGGYRWRPQQGDGSSAPASLTGLPTVLGWYHEAQYRGDAAYRTRLGAVRTVYTGDDPNQREVLERYDVTYVYVGPAERASYGTITVGDLSATSVAREWPEVTIYEVDQSAL